MTKKYLKMIILNLAIVLSAVFCYSEGFLALRPWDASILRAGMSIFVAIADVFAFFYGNHALLKPAERSFYTSDAIPDLGKAKEILSAFHGMKYFGKLSDTAAGQIDRLFATLDRADRAIGMKFEGGSMAHDRYRSTVEAARVAAIKNCAGMANRLQMFDEREYEALQHYKEDDIPDEIQEKQIALYEKNMENVREAVAANEKLILALDEMSMKLTSADQAGSGDNAILEEIDKLTEQVKLYI
ncbi:MAG: hypothetical protein IJ682_04860 [Lachnospiraceae bacterium]|nr:hypothetical protein [Lachnospiraceae bacterium]